MTGWFELIIRNVVGYVVIVSSTSKNLTWNFCFVSVQHLSDENQMTVRNLGIVFGPTLFQTDGTDITASQVVEELIQNYCSIFNVSLSLMLVLITLVSYIDDC